MRIPFNGRLAVVDPPLEQERPQRDHTGDNDQQEPKAGFPGLVIDPLHSPDNERQSEDRADAQIGEEQTVEENHELVVVGHRHRIGVAASNEVSRRRKAYRFQRRCLTR